MLTWSKRRAFLAAFGGTFLVAGIPGAASASEFKAMLTGDNELLAADTDGWGRAKIDINDTLNTLCTDLEVRSIDEVTSARIFRGRAGEEGTPVVQLDRPDDEDSDDCDNIGDALADEIQSNPAEFYVSVSTREFPQGAIRGQLGPSSD
jgi:hypothetical protein